MASVYLVLDMINDVVHENGSFGKTAVAEQVKARRVAERTAALVNKARAAKVPVGFIRIGLDYLPCVFEDACAAANAANYDAAMLISQR